ncbi:alpha/beta fold hydrolase [Dictyobacter formicarum]|uniref:Hydrolase n=1 Tax=Dictyobacter formicarum TaxID=2778368 RepID=A0ABQ3VAQ4_9CHLR|nr:alpha/beta hydrolase [Dictyobacter formicarum]GHO83099.1 hydrolase [Dictyobacter formicarum]
MATVSYRNIKVDDIQVFYREAGEQHAQTLVLLHGFPSSSHMFRNLLPVLGEHFHVVAPDYPGYGYSNSPSVEQFAYTFDHLEEIVEKVLDTLKLKRFSIYVQDYGAPVGFRLAVKYPERIKAIISQNGNAYREGFTSFWDAAWPFWSHRDAETEKPIRGLLTRETTIWQYTTGVREKEHISPDAWTFDQLGLDRPGNADIQLALFEDYRTNPQRYPQWHEYFRHYQPPLLAVWGKNDPIFSPAGAEAFKHDLPNCEVHLLDTGHFALEEDGEVIAEHVTRFLTAKRAT